MKPSDNYAFVKRGSVILGSVALLSLLYVQLTKRAPETPPTDDVMIVAGPHPHSLVAEPTTLAALEARGFTLNRVLGAKGSSNSDLMESRAYADLVSTLDADLTELHARPASTSTPTFEHEWLSGAGTRFALSFVAPRLDRAFAETGTCGELRLVYTLVRSDRGNAALPMTLSVLMVPHGDAAACQELARSFIELPERGQARVAAVAAILTRRSAAPRRIEAELRNVVMRSFDVAPNGLVPHALTNTPREDLTNDEKTALATSITSHFTELDQGTYVMPETFAAKRAFSEASRNQPFSAVLGDDTTKLFASLPYDSAKIVKSPRALLRRLDQSAAVSVSRANDLESELPWRERQLAAIAKGAVYIEPLPLIVDAAPPRDH